MFATSKTKRRLAGSILLIILSIIINAVLNHYSGINGFLPIATGCIIAVWIQSIRRRIINKNVRLIIIAIALLLMVFNFLQMLKNDMTNIYLHLQRYAWYGYYIVFIAVPLLCFFLSLTMKQETDEIRFKKRNLLFLPSLILLGLVLTNDLHQQVFRFPQGLELGTDIYTYRWGYYLIASWIGVMFILSVIMSFRYCMFSASRRYIWMPMIVLLLGLGYFVLYYAGYNIRINGAELIPITQAFCYIIGLFIEMLIQTGILPSNDGYSEFFNTIGMYAGIMNNSQQMILETDYLLQDPEAIYRFNSAKVHGGEMVWAEDITQVEEYKKVLASERDQLLSEEAILKEEAALQRDQAVLEVYNKIYDRIPEVVAPQLKRLRELVNTEHGSEEIYRENLKEACILNTYIKRKSNLMIIANDVSMIEVEELYLSMRESLDNLKNFGVKTACFNEVSECWSWEELFMIYDYFERFIEENFRRLKSLMININLLEDVLEVRFMVAGNDLVYPEDLLDKPPVINNDEETTTIIIEYRRYGNGYTA